MRSGAIPALRDRRLAGLRSSELRAQGSELGGSDLIMLELVLSDTYYIDNNEPLKLPDTRAVKPELRVQSGCAAERYPRYGTGGSPGFAAQS